MIQTVGDSVVNRVDLLARVPFFQTLDLSDIEALADELRVHELVPGDNVFHGGDSGYSMFIVAVGAVCIQVLGTGRASRTTLALLGVGSCFGEIALFDDKPRSANDPVNAQAIAQATCDTVLLELGRRSLVKCIGARPSVAMGILRAVSGRLRVTNAMVGERVWRDSVGVRNSDRKWSDRIADRVSSFNGSWKFIFILSGLSVAWAIINIPGYVDSPPPDRYPYIFYNLVIAVFIALQWPLVAMSQNRRAAKERVESELDYKVNLKNETNCELVLTELLAFRNEWKGCEKGIAGLLEHHGISTISPHHSKTTTIPNLHSRSVSSID